VFVQLLVAKQRIDVRRDGDTESGSRDAGLFGMSRIDAHQQTLCISDTGSVPTSLDTSHGTTQQGL
jgi:hypothetical protein